MKMHAHIQLGLPFMPQRVDPNADTRVQMAMYLLQSPVLRDFVRPLGVNAYVVGLVVERYLEQKIVETGLRGYASIVAPLHDRQNALLVHPDAGAWRLMRLPDPRCANNGGGPLGQLPAGGYREGVITFRLPHELRIADVEAQFHHQLAARNLNTFLKGATGRQRLAAARMPVAARLFTDYEEFGEPRRSLASWIYLVNPQRELPVLLQALSSALGACGEHPPRHAVR